jgi:hypothetical protein
MVNRDNIAHSVGTAGSTGYGHIIRNDLKECYEISHLTAYMTQNTGVLTV